MRAADFDHVERLLERAASLEPKATEIRLLRTELRDRRGAQSHPPPPVRDASATFPARPPIQTGGSAFARGKRRSCGSRHRCRRRPRSGAARRSGSSGRSRPLGWPLAVGGWERGPRSPLRSSLVRNADWRHLLSRPNRLRSRDVRPPAPAIDVAPVSEPPTSTTPAIERRARRNAATATISSAGIATPAGSR